jgi:para-nitrobenzyl esterase
MAPTGTPLHRFLGVRYAAPPVGHRRWARPVPPAPWSGIQVADTFGPAAPQRESLAALPTFRPTATAEDCLTLNVWTPTLTGSRPVVVWVHGGAFTTGGSSQPVYDGARLAAEQDVAVVTINYRLGALGFLCVDDATPDGDVVANAGLHDQLAALRWVRDHAAALGGNPETITVFGESAGAGSILHLIAATGSDPPFTRAIAQSGEPRTIAREEAKSVAAAFAAAVGVDRPDTAHLRDVPVEAVLDAQDRVTLELVAKIGAMPFAPSVDGGLLDRDVRAGFEAGRGASIDLLLGTTRDELRLFPDPAVATMDEARLRRRVARTMPHADPTAAIAAYRAALPGDVTSGEIWDAVRTDAMMRVPNLHVAEARAARGVPAFVYRFDWTAPSIGAAHAVDIPFTFGTFDREGWGEAIGYDPDAEVLGVNVRAAWAGFARHGVPGTDTLGLWPRYEPPRRATMLLGRRSGVVDDPDRLIRRHHL